MKVASLSGFIPFFETFKIVSYPFFFNSFSMAFIVRLFPKRRKVQNKMAFPPSLRFILVMKAAVSFAGLDPSTGVPRMRGSKLSIVEGKVPAMFISGAFMESDIAWARRCVLPVLEK